MGYCKCTAALDERDQPMARSPSFIWTGKWADASSPWSQLLFIQIRLRAFGNLMISFGISCGPPGAIGAERNKVDAGRRSSIAPQIASKPAERTGRRPQHPMPVSVGRSTTRAGTQCRNRCPSRRFVLSDAPGGAACWSQGRSRLPAADGRSGHFSCIRPSAASHRLFAESGLEISSNRRGIPFPNQGLLRRRRPASRANCQTRPAGRCRSGSSTAMWTAR